MQEEKKNHDGEELEEAEELEEVGESELGELEKVRYEADEYKRKWYAVSAEYDNFRKRNAQAVSKAYADGASEAVLKFLPIADSFGYALDSATDEKTKSGIDKVIKQFKSILSSLGIEESPVTVGCAFDENLAEAVMNVPCEEGEEPNTIKMILKKGYRYKDKVIRFAQVTVTV